jgi:hypothetical protein
MMFGGHFYHAILRKSVAVFGTLFNDINIVRKTSGGEGTITKVPLAYGPKQKFLSRIDEQSNLNDNKLAIKLPRMSFEITSLDYDTETVGNKFNQITVQIGEDTRDSVNYVPYNIGMQLNVMVKNQDEGLQILEQILPTFTPTYSVTANMIDNLDHKVDIPVTLNSVSIQDDYEGDFESRRVLVYTLDFTMKTRFFGKIDRTSVIKISQMRIAEEFGKSIENITSSVVPFEARESEPHTIVTEFNYIPPSNTITLSAVTSELKFKVGEFLVGDTTGVGGTIVSAKYEGGKTVLEIDNLDGYYQIGETITGLVSLDQVTVESFTVN